MLRKKLQKEKLNTIGVEELTNCYSVKEFAGNHKLDHITYFYNLDYFSL